MEQLIKKSILLKIIRRTGSLDIPKWTIQQSNVMMKLSKLLKTKIYLVTNLEKFSKISLKYLDHFSIFCDGSKGEEKKLLSAEAWVIELALNLLAMNKPKKFMCCDSRAVLILQEIKNWKPTNYQSSEQDTCYIQN